MAFAHEVRRLIVQASQERGWSTTPLTEAECTELIGRVSSLHFDGKPLFDGRGSDNDLSKWTTPSSTFVGDGAAEEAATGVGVAATLLLHPFGDLAAARVETRHLAEIVGDVASSYSFLACSDDLRVLLQYEGIDQIWRRWELVVH